MVNVVGYFMFYIQWYCHLDSNAPNWHVWGTMYNQSILHLIELIHDLNDLKHLFVDGRVVGVGLKI